jgi:hypothetical protein
MGRDEKLARAGFEQFVAFFKAGAREHRREALDLCDELGTDTARALAAELEPQRY